MMDSLELRTASSDDAARVWEWNSAPDVRAQSLDPRPIPLASHRRWWADRVRAADRPVWIIEHDGEPVGVIRIDPVGCERTPTPWLLPETGSLALAWRISIALSAAARGRGIGRRAIELACAAWGRPLIAEIRTANAASRAAFEAAGFRLGPIRPCADRTVFTYTWRP